MRFFKEENNNVVFLLDGEEIKGNAIEIKANTVDAAKEKHVPIVSYGDDKMTVSVGSIEHPMGEDHYIMWIAVVSGNDIQIKKLSPKDKPIATFNRIENAQVYAYCNLHGLWKS